MAYILQQRLPDHIRHSPRRRRDRIIGQVSLAGGGLDLDVAKQFADHWQICLCKKRQLRPLPVDGPPSSRETVRLKRRKSGKSEMFYFGGMTHGRA